VSIKTTDGEIRTGEENVKEEVRLQTQQQFDSQLSEHKIDSKWFVSNKVKEVRQFMEKTSENITNPISVSDVKETFRRMKRNKCVPDKLCAEIYKAGIQQTAETISAKRMT